MLKMTVIIGFLFAGMACSPLIRATAADENGAAGARLPIPDRLVVLTFDDSGKSHFTVGRAAPEEVWLLGHVLHHRGVRLPDEQARLHDLGGDRATHTGRLRDRQPHARPPGRHRRKRRRTCRAGAWHQRSGARSTASQRRLSFAYPGNVIAMEALPVLEDMASSSPAAAGARSIPTRRAAASPTSRVWIIRC